MWAEWTKVTERRSGSRGCFKCNTLGHGESAVPFFFFFLNKRMGFNASFLYFSSEPQLLAKLTHTVLSCIAVLLLSFANLTFV